jgi:hypothetical protein
LCQDREKIVHEHFYVYRHIFNWPIWFYDITTVLIFNDGRKSQDVPVFFLITKVLRMRMEGGRSRNALDGGDTEQGGSRAGNVIIVFSWHAS